jgi:DNA primase
MEGYTDVVIARQFGVDNAVAVLGTALGQRHIQLLRRFADRITLLLDGDQAGQRRASEIVDLFIANQVELRIVTLPGNLDPCDFLLQQGREALLELVAQAPDAWDYKIQLELRGVDPLRDTHRANQALENLLAALAKAPRASVGSSGAAWLRQQQFINRLAREFRLDPQQLRHRLDEQRRQRPALKVVASTAPLAATRPVLTSVERDLFELLLQQPAAAELALSTIQASQLQSATARQLLQMFTELCQQGVTPDIQGLLLSTDDPQLKSLLVELDEGGNRKTNVDRQAALQELLETLQKRHTEEQLRRQQAELEGDGLDEQQKLQMLLQILRTKQALIDH